MQLEINHVKEIVSPQKTNVVSSPLLVSARIKSQMY